MQGVCYVHLENTIYVDNLLEIYKVSRVSNQSVMCL